MLLSSSYALQFGGDRTTLRQCNGRFCEYVGGIRTSVGLNYEMPKREPTRRSVHSQCSIEITGYSRMYYGYCSSRSFSALVNTALALLFFSCWTLHPIPPRHVIVLTPQPRRAATRAPCLHIPFLSACRLIYDRLHSNRLDDAMLWNNKVDATLAAAFAGHASLLGITSTLPVARRLCGFGANFGGNLYGTSVNGARLRCREFSAFRRVG